MKHLTPDEVLALAEADLIPDGHAAGCVSCRDEVLALRSIIGAARGIEIPEPSPLFWDHLSARVRNAIDDEPLPAHQGLRVPASWRWRFLSGALASAVVAGLLVVGRTPATFSPASPGPGPGPTPAAASLPDVPIVLDEDGGIDFELVADAAGNLAVDDAGQLLGVGAPGASDRVLAALSDEEEQELARLLRAEMEKGRPS